MSRTFTKLMYHVVFSTKLRAPLIAPNVASELHPYLAAIVRGEDGEAIAIGGVADHVHLLVRLKPTHTLADLLRVLKANSSKWINDHGKVERKFAWQDGYAAFTVGESQVSTVVRYIKNQEHHHRRVSFHDELQSLLERHGVPFDDRDLGD